MDYKLEDLIDIPLLQNLLDKMNLINSFPTAIIDNDGKILTTVGWQDICSKFHRQNPQCEKECIKSDQYILEHLHEAQPAVSYQCPHGLIDNATPIIIDGKHLGNFFTGQFFLEKPDLDYFKIQAEKYGFDEKAYLEAVEKVPIWTKEKLGQYLDFIKEFIEMITGIGLNHIKETETNKVIKECEEKYRSVVENIHEALLIEDVDGKLVYANVGFCKMFGYPREELMSLTLKDYTSPEWQKEITERHSLRMKGIDVPDEFEYEGIRKDGTKIWIEARVTLLKHAGVIIGTQSLERDITGRKQAEEEIALLAHAVKSTNECISITDMHNIILYVNQSFLDSYGYQFDELIGQNISIVVSPNNPPGILDDILAATLDDGWKGELLNHKKDGSEFPISLSTSKIKNKYGNFVSLIGMATDITERKQAEEKLRASEDHYRDLVENSQDLICIHDLEGHILSANPWAGKVLGYEIGTILQMNIRDFLAPEVRGGVEAYLAKIRKRGTANGLLFVQTAAGERRIWEYNNTLRTEGVAIPVVRGLAHDITERKQAEEKFFKLAARQKALLAAVPDIIMEVNSNKEYTWANQSGLVFFGDDVIGKEAAFYFEGEQETCNIVQPLFNGSEEVFYVESWQRRKDGEKRLLAWWCRTLQDKDGNIIGAISSAHDITERKQVELELAAEKKRLSEILRGTNVGSWEWNIQTGETILNERWAGILGYTLKEISPTSIETWRKFVYPEDSKVSDELLEKHIKGELDYYECEARMKHKNGDWVWVLDRGRVHEWDKNGTPLLMSGTHQDITERKLAEKALRESESKFKLFIDHAIEALYLHEISGEIIDVNETAVNDSGYSRYELLQLTAFDIDPFLRNFENRAEIWEQLPPFEYQTFYGYHRHKSGTLYPIEVRVGKILLNGKVYMLSLAQNITERKRAEELLKESEKRFRLLFDKAPMGYQSLDIDGNFIDVNQAWLDTLGYRREEVIGKWFGDFLAPGTIDAFRDRYILFKAKGKVHSEVEMLHKNGHHLFITIEGRIGYDMEGGIKQTHCILKDITEQKQLEEELLEKMNELQRFHDITVGREITMIELKKEVNDLLKKSGLNEKYRIVE